MRKTIALLVVWLLASGWGSPAFALSEAEVDRVMLQIERGEPAGTEFVLGHAELSPPYLLLIAAKVAAYQGRLEDAAFLFYAGLVRLRIDLRLFPLSHEEPGLDAFVAIATDQLGPRLTHALMQSPELYDRLVARLERWQPEVPPGYDPGWHFVPREGPPDVRQAIHRVKQEALSGSERVLPAKPDPGGP